MIAKRFLFICAGLLCLALSYHLGAKAAGAQAGGQAIVGWQIVGVCYGQTDFVVVTSKGDFYRRRWECVAGSPSSTPALLGAPVLIGNFWN